MVLFELYLLGELQKQLKDFGKKVLVKERESVDNSMENNQGREFRKLMIGGE